MNKDTSLYFRRDALLPHVVMRRANQSCACYHTHTHDEFSFGVMDAGTATYRNRRQQKRIHQGMTVMINPGDAHSCNPDAGQYWSYRMLFIDVRWMARLQADIPCLASGDYTPFALTCDETTQSYHPFDTLFTTLEQAQNPLAADEKLICFLMEHCFSNRDLRLDRARAQRPLERARELIMDQLTDQVTLTTIADVSGLSPYHLIRSFKQAYGQTPHAFQLDQRINRSKELLKQGMTLVDAAQQLGFADQSHFQRHFKNRNAVTPRAYQRSLVT